MIPVGPDRYELYCEQPIVADSPDADSDKPGIVGRLRARFRKFLRDAEERQRAGGLPPEPQNWMGRMQDRAMAWAVERIAEQRLLWNLRGSDAAVAAHPDDMLFPHVLPMIQQMLQRDYERHRRWMFIDGVLFIVTFVALGPLFLLIPGIANLPALYFGFRTVGHFLSMRGAIHGMRRVRWTGRPCPPLRELRPLIPLAPHERADRLHDISNRLRLEHLDTFFDRVAIPRG